MVDNPEYEKLTLVTLGGGGGQTHGLAATSIVNDREPKSRFLAKNRSWAIKRFCGQNSQLQPQNQFTTQNSTLCPIRAPKIDSNPKNRF